VTKCRVVAMGEDRQRWRQTPWAGRSSLCGGTHVRRTGDKSGSSSVVGPRRAVAAGVRRIEALTGNGRARKAAHHVRRSSPKAAAAELKVSVEGTGRAVLLKWVDETAQV